MALRGAHGHVSLRLRSVGTAGDEHHVEAKRRVPEPHHCPAGQHVSNLNERVLVVERLGVRAGAREESEAPDEGTRRNGPDQGAARREDPPDLGECLPWVRDVLENLGANDRSEGPVGERQILDVALDDLVAGQPLAKDGDVPRVDVDPDGSGRQPTEVQPGTRTGIEEGRMPVPGHEAADGPRSISMEERLGAPKVVGHIDPVVRLDVAVVVFHPLGPGRRPFFKVELGSPRGVLDDVGLHWSPLKGAQGTLPHHTRQPSSRQTVAFRHRPREPVSRAKARTRSWSKPGGRQASPVFSDVYGADDPSATRRRPHPAATSSGTAPPGTMAAMTAETSLTSPTSLTSRTRRGRHATRRGRHATRGGATPRPGAPRHAPVAPRHALGAPLDVTSGGATATDLRWRAVRDGLVIAGLAFAVYLFLVEAPITKTVGFDAYAYWTVHVDQPYRLEAGAFGAFPYSPVLVRVFALAGLLDWQAFLWLWEAVLVATVIWLGWRRTLWVLAFPPVAVELYHGNIHLLLAAAIALGFRYPAAWAFVLLSKVTPGVDRRLKPLRIRLKLYAVS